MGRSRARFLRSRHSNPGATRPPDPQPAGPDAPKGFGTFFLPGPTEVRPEVLRAMTQPMIAHRGKEFEALFARLQENLRVVFRTARPVFVSSSSATGLMEASARVRMAELTTRST